VDYRSEQQYAQQPEADKDKERKRQAGDGQSARAQSAELHRERKRASGAEAKVRDLLSYGAFDWKVTDKEALQALSQLAGLSEGSLRGVLARLEQDGYVDRLLDNLPTSAMKSRSADMLKLYTALPEHVLNARVEQLMATGLLDWGISKNEAQQVAQILVALPAASRKRFIYRDGGKAFDRLMRVLHPEQAKEDDKAKAQQEKKDKDGAPKPMEGTRKGVARHQDDPGVLERMWAGQKAARGVLGGDIDLQEVETTLGGDMGGIQLAERASEDENKLGLDLDWEKGYLIGTIPSLNIAAMQANAGDATVATGAGRLSGLQVQIKWSTELDPDSEMQLQLDHLAMLDVQVLARQLTVVIGSLALSGLEVFAAKPPERMAKPTSKSDAFKAVRQQISEVIGLTLPSLASMRDADPNDPASLVDRLKDNFGGDLDLSFSLDDAQIRDVKTSDGDSMEEMDLRGLDISVRQMPRVTELDTELKRLQLAAKERELEPAERERLDNVRSELERLRPLNDERNKLLGKRKGKQGLTTEEEDRLVELDNELNVGVATIDLDELGAKGIEAKGHKLDEGKMEGLHARVSGGDLTQQRKTKAEQLDERLGAVAPGKLKDPDRPAERREDSRAEVSVKSVDTKGYVGDKAALAEGHAGGIEVRADQVMDPGKLSAHVAAGELSARELQTEQGSAGSVDVRGLSGKVSQADQVAQVSVEEAHAAQLCAQGATVDTVSVHDLSGQVTDYADKDKLTAKASLGGAEVAGVQSEQGAVDKASIHGVRAAAGPGLKDAGVDVSGAKVSGVQSEHGTLDAASLEGLHLEGTDLLDADKRAGAASLDRAQAMGVQTAQGKVDSAELEGLRAGAGPGLKTAYADLDRAAVGGVQTEQGALKSATVQGVHVEGTDLLDADRRAASGSVASAEALGLQSELGTVDRAALEGLQGQVGPGMQQASLDLKSAEVTGAKGDLGKVDRAAVSGVHVDAADLTDAEKRTLGASVGSAQVRGLDAAGVKAGALDAQGMKGTLKGDRASVDVDRVGATDVAHTGPGRSASVGEASAEKLHLAGTGPGDFEAKAGVVRAKDVEGAQGDAGGSLGYARLEGVAARGDRSGMHASLKDAELTDLAAHQGDRKASVGRIVGGDMEAHAGPGKDPKISAGVGELAVQDARYRDADQTASVGQATVKDLQAKDVGLSKAGAPKGDVSLSAGVEDVRYERGETSGSVGAAAVDDLRVSADGRGEAYAAFEAAGVRDVKGKHGQAASGSVGSVDVGPSEAALSGLGPGGKPKLDAARTEGVSVKDVRGHAQPGALLPKGQAQPGKATPGKATPGAQTQALTPGTKKPGLPQIPGQEKGEEFKADALAGMSGDVHVELPVVKPIRTTITVDVPVREGMVDLRSIKMKGTGLLGGIGAATTDIVVNKRGALVIDIIGPKNITVIEPGTMQGLISKKQGGGKHGTIAIEPLIEGLMNPTVEDDESGEDWPEEIRQAAEVKKKKRKDKKKKKGKKDDELPLELSKTRVSLGGLKLGEGRLGTETMGMTLSDRGDGDINKLEVDATLGESAHLGTKGLHAEDITAVGPDGQPIRVGDAAVDDLNVLVDKPLDDQRTIDAQVGGVELRDVEVGDQEKLRKKRPQS